MHRTRHGTAQIPPSAQNNKKGIQLHISSGSPSAPGAALPGMKALQPAHYCLCPQVQEQQVCDWAATH